MANAGVTNNNGTNVETLNVPMTILGTTTFNAASNNLVISNGIAGTGTLNSTATNTSTNLVVMGGSNTFTGNIAVLSGTLTIGPGGVLNNNATPPTVRAVPLSITSPSPPMRPSTTAAPILRL
jgi:autotransporter-associated beta strand protein